MTWGGPPPAAGEGRLDQVPVDAIHDRPWATEIDESDPAYVGLRSSIRASGVIQPLLVRPTAAGLQLVSGARRLRAARQEGVGAVPVIVRPLSDLEALVGGAWDALLRTGVTQRQAREVEQLLLEGGLGAADAAALLSSVPRRLALRDEDEPEAASNSRSEVVARPRTPGAAPAAAGDQTALTPAVGPVSFAVPAEAGAAAPATTAPTAGLPALVAQPSDLAGWPAGAGAEGTLAPTSPPPELPIDPEWFPVTGEDERTAPAPAAAPPPSPPSTLLSAAAGPEAAEVVPAAAAGDGATRPVVIRINLPGPDAAAEGPVSNGVVAPPAPAAAVAPVAPPPPPPSSAAGPVAAVDRPGPPPTASVPPGAEAPGAPMTPADPVPAEPVPAVAGSVRRREGSTEGTSSSMVLATVGIALAVGAIVFIVTSVLQNAGNGRDLVVAVVVAAVGLLCAMISLATPGRRV